MYVYIMLHMKRTNECCQLREHPNRYLKTATQKNRRCSFLRAAVFKSPIHLQKSFYIRKRALFCDWLPLWSQETPPPRGFSYLLCSLIQNPEEEDTPQSTWYNFFEGGPLPPGSLLGSIVNRLVPMGGGVSCDQFESTILSAQKS